MRFLLFITLFFLCIDNYSNSFIAKEHEIWWEKSLGQTIEWNQFAKWLGDEDANSRVCLYKYLLSKEYQSILDVPCGLCVDYWGLKKYGIIIDYTGLDITPKLINRAKEMNIKSYVGSIENIPFDDNSFDVTYARHILEHLDTYHTAIKELCRVAKNEALIIFFIKPRENIQRDVINKSIDRGCVLYHNVYRLSSLENFLKSLPKVSCFEWEEVDSNEVILHIYVKEKI